MDPDGNKSKDFLRLSTIMPYDVTLYDLLIEMKLHYITLQPCFMQIFRIML